MKKGKANGYVVIYFVDTIATWPTKLSLDLEGTESENRPKLVGIYSLQGVGMIRNYIFTRKLAVIGISHDITNLRILGCVLHYWVSGPDFSMELFCLHL
jgi:hypothetical protein